jgi:hypothetical protein
MKNWRKPFALVALVCAMTIPCLANIAPPNPPAKKPQNGDGPTARLRILSDPTRTEARLVIPAGVLKQLRAEMDERETNMAALTSSAFLPPAQTAISGFFLSFSVILAGFWFLNYRKNKSKAPRVAMALAVVVLGGAVTSLVYANAGPPPGARTLNSKILAKEFRQTGASGDVKIEIVESGTFIQVLLPAKSDNADDE